MKVIFFGTPQFAVPSLNELKKQKIDIVAVVTQPDKPVGRKKLITKSSVKKCAEELNLKILQPKNQKELFDSLKGLKADFFIVIAYGMILTREILKMPKYACINVHASLLPKYRGASPIQEALLNGDKSSGISIIKMDEKLDHGSIYLIKRVEIAEKDDLISLSNKMAKLSSEILPHVLKNIKKRLLIPIKQDEDHQKPSYCRKIKKKDGKINWKKQSAEEIKNMIRAYIPWPGVYTNFKGKKLKILDSAIAEENLNLGEFKVDRKTLKIGTAKGVLMPKKVQIEGKNEMNITSFINGYMK